ncbi:hypothetical protein [Fodinicurvata fenggangensis]|uniref:hypothetical protein n=1 Tax=Fodinicurvata fenggangensis TaxID=1121830 RepID=UPI0012DF81DF|nr:hypothetical protein [Fodinicurvata fenggangensis]
MHLIFLPQRADREVTYARDGDTFLIDGEAIDLSGDWAILEPDVEGEPLEPSGNLLAGRRENGEITLTVRAPHKPQAEESDRYPVPINLADDESITLSGIPPEPEPPEDPEGTEEEPAE